MLRQSRKELYKNQFIYYLPLWYLGVIKLSQKKVCSGGLGDQAAWVTSGSIFPWPTWENGLKCNQHSEAQRMCMCDFYYREHYVTKSKNKCNKHLAS